MTYHLAPRAAGKTGCSVVLPLLLIGSLMMFFGLSTIYARAVQTFHGEIVNRSIACNDPSNPLRCITTYTLQGGSDEPVTPLVVGYTDPDIAQDLPVGATIQKARWQLGYSLNGQRVADFPIIFYALVSSIGLVGVTSGFIISHKWREE